MAMATYNGAAHLREQLDSFRAQQRLPDELVVSDDGSTDGTTELIQAFAARAPFEVSIHRNPERLGYSQNFARAASLSTGDLVSFSDQDDKWYPEKLSTVCEEFARNSDAQLVVNNQDIAVAGLEPSGRTMLDNVRALGYGDAYFTSGCCMTVRRSFLDLVLPFPDTVAYDHWCGHMADLLGVRRLIETSLQAYRRHSGNTSNDVSAEVSPSMMSVMKRYGLRDARPGWNDEIAIKQLYAERLQQKREVAAKLSSPERVDAALKSIDGDIRWLRERLAMLELPRVKRSGKVISRWCSGFYDRKFGWKSAAKDLVRP
jgi:glycosyltransferase involved in cell wall biosynthesis